ncbi:heterokaryon incompatibility protein-domain-containing protein [Paraphoma chrysanthemicola]|uniref:Heterokaryon incompatibility protein-domain-containing protein n=1 Tax=Paraphoma chrysanthemicola TaxID=798071 RepID=A0A8K0R474_9PLEO|nr:heterokaryon incompatibility protein-domain-containing protein [Paraphoma chrysanthemicola]
MCFSTKQYAEHQCIPQCPICWQFTETNLQSLIVGETLHLGTAYDFQEATMGARGCHLCASIIRAIVASPQGRRFVPEASMSMRVKLAKNEFDINAREIEFTIENPEIDLWKDPAFRMQQLALAPELASTKTWLQTLSYTLPAGLFTKGGIAERYIKNNAANASVSSPEVFETARRWISECSSVHPKCPQSKPHSLPTRVLEVSPSSTSNAVRLVETNGKVGHYAALSYCWGTTRQLTTVQATLEAHKKSIDVERLPKTIQDAITTTRALCITYLWIDSLCIVQDSNEDKAKEISKMSSIYKSAMVTISAASVSDSNDGFLHDRQEVLERTQASYRLPYTDLDDQVGDLYICTDNQMGYSIKDYSKEPLDTRAWTLQETWLSPRLLTYGTGPLKWRCLSRNYTHGLKENKSDDFDFLAYVQNHPFCYSDRIGFFKEAELATRHISSTASENDSWSSTWNSLVSNFQRRQLTVKTDKLPALSGIATEFQKLNKDMYLAGLWKSSLPWSLLWYCQVAIKPEPFHQETIRYGDDASRHFQVGSVQPTASSPDIRGRIRRKGLYSKMKAHLFHRLSKGRADGSLDPPPGTPEDAFFHDVGATFFALGYPLRSEVLEYIAPSWSFASSSLATSFDRVTLMTPKMDTKVTIHSANTSPTYDIAPLAQIWSGYITLTGPMQRMTFKEIDERFILCIDEEPHIFWDYIIPDRGLLNKYINQASRNTDDSDFYTWRNPQRERIKQKITNRMLDEKNPVDDEPEAPNPRPTPKRGRIPPATGAIPEFWLLELTWTEVPKGLLLVRREDDLFERAGYFKMGRHLWESTDWRSRGLQTAGPRDWDWYGGLRMCTITMV